MLTQRAVILLVLAHAGIAWTAVAFRVDQFPLTWAPMYSTHVATDEPEYREVFKDRRFVELHGWRGFRRDGGEEWIRRADVNVPTRSMWRLYYQRTWGQSPPKEGQKNSGGWTLDRWARGLPAGAPICTTDWRRRLLESLNKTLKREPDDPAFLVRVAAVRTVMRFDRDSLELLGRSEETTEIVWRDEWRRDFAR